MHKNATKCNKKQSKWCINKHGASKIIDTLETYQRGAYGGEYLRTELHLRARGGRRLEKKLVKLEQNRATNSSGGGWRWIQNPAPPLPYLRYL
jgi:hypothetical protein